LAPLLRYLALLTLVVVGWGVVGIALAQARTPRPTHWRITAEETPLHLHVNEQGHVPVTLHNTDDLAWSHAAGDRLAYHWYDAQGALVDYEGRRTPLAREGNGDLLPGQSRGVLATLVAPQKPGVYYLQWAMVREGTGWYLPPDGATAQTLAYRVEVRPGDAGWRLVEAQLLGPVHAGEPAQARVRLRNETSIPWDSAHNSRLSYHWRDTSGAVVQEGVRTQFSQPVAPGQTVELLANLRGPKKPGTYRLDWEPVQEGLRWFGPPREPASVTVTVTPSPRKWALGSATPPATLPRTLAAAEVVSVALVVRNTGTEVWSGDRGDRLSYRWHRDGMPPLEGLRTALPEPLHPGIETAVTATLRAPEEPGSYTLEWALVREGVAWYPATGATNHVEVGPHQLACEITSVAWPSWMAVNGSDDVTVTVRNTGQVTWSAEAGDRLSYHWWGPDGESVVFDGLRTHLPHPVAPGESITLEAEVAGPRTAGAFDLGFEMVREQVTWYGSGPEKNMHPQTSTITVVWRSGLLQITWWVLTILMVVFVRRRRPQTTRGWALWGTAPAWWAGAATVLLILSFAELSSYSLWKGAWWVAGSSAALGALLVLLVPGRARPWAGFLWVTGSSVLILADLIYMHFCGSIVPFQAVSGAHQVGDIGASVGAALGGSHAWLLPVPLAGLALALGLPYPRGDDRPPTRLRRRVWGLACAGICLWLLPFGIRMGQIMASDLGYRVYSEQRNVGRLGVLGAHLFDALRTLRERTGRGSATPEEVAEVRAWFADRADWQPPADLPLAEQAGAAGGSNVMIIQVESMQGWVVGAEVEGQEITPFLNRMRSQARYYPHYADLTAQGMTSDSEYATLHSQLPLAQGALAFLRADNQFLTLGHVLKDAGYSTFSAHPYKRGFWNRALLHPRYGFDESWFRRELGDGLVVGWGLADGLFFDRVLPKLRELDASDRPFFAFLVTLSVHHPYDSFPPSLVELNLGELEGTALGNYIHGMHYTDASLQHLFEQLGRAGILEHTIVAVYGDHDSRLGNDPDLLRLAGVARWSPATTAELERVPAFLWVPSTGDPVRGEVATVGGHIDLAPTILHYLGIPRPSVFLGRPLLPGRDDGIAVFADGSAQGGGLLWLASGPGVPEGGMCLTAAGNPKPASQCTALAERAADMLRHSRRVLDHDLARILVEPTIPNTD